MNYYERHLGDYARDTSHLTIAEHGAYTLLLDRYYATERPIPADQVHRLARARSSEEVTLAAMKKGIASTDLRHWGAVFAQAAKDGHIRRSEALFRRALGNGTLSPGWTAA